MAAIAVMPLFAFGILVARGPATSSAPELSVPVATFNLPLTPEQVDRRIAGLMPRPNVPTKAPDIPSTPPGSIQLAALKHPAPLPYFPPAVAVTVPPLVIGLGTPPEFRPLPVIATPELPPLVVSPPVDRSAVAALPPQLPEPPNQCVARDGGGRDMPPAVAVTSLDFARSLVAAAMEQTSGVAVYQARYVRIAYPGGDVSPFYGVCSDVVIRAYRAQGIDLQLEVQKARVGRGDTSIDHRRTETLRSFFARMGETLPVTEFAEDYQPGDIVTYYRPQNRSSTSHIAIVSDVMAPSGRPMIIHNRGFGVQLEDGLFVDKITGHYRYRGTMEPIAVAAAKTKQPMLARVAMRTPQSRPANTLLSVPTAVSTGVPLGR